VGQEVAHESFGHSATANVSLLMWPTIFFANCPYKGQIENKKLEKNKF
jgi:hypothetical protein